MGPKKGSQKCSKMESFLTLILRCFSEASFAPSGSKKSSKIDSKSRSFLRRRILRNRCTVVQNRTPGASKVGSKIEAFSGPPFRCTFWPFWLPRGLPLGSILGSFFGTFFGTLFGDPKTAFYKPVLARNGKRVNVYQMCSKSILAYIDRRIWTHLSKRFLFTACGLRPRLPARPRPRFIEMEPQEPPDGLEKDPNRP